jgi:hypothetical protein
MHQCTIRHRNNKRDLVIVECVVVAIVANLQTRFTCQKADGCDPGVHTQTGDVVVHRDVEIQ